MSGFACALIDDLYAGFPELKEILLKHSLQVREKAFCILSDSGLSLDRELISTGALLHDIGIFRCHAPGICCTGEADYMAHGIIGGEILRQYGREKGVDMEPFARICERHTGSGLTEKEIIAGRLPLPPRDYLPETPEEKLICLADKFFSKSGRMEEKPFEAVRKSMARFGQEPLARFDALCAFFKQ